MLSCLAPVSTISDLVGLGHNPQSKLLLLMIDKISELLYGSHSRTGNWFLPAFSPTQSGSIEPRP